MVNSKGNHPEKEGPIKFNFKVMQKTVYGKGQYCVANM